MKLEIKSCITGAVLYSGEADEIRCGCFRGSISDFKKQVAAKYDSGHRHNSEYMAAIAFFKTCASLIPAVEAKDGLENYEKMKIYKWGAPK